MLLSTTYPLNKSNSKRLKVGLENEGGVFYPKVKICGHGSASRDVTFDIASWEEFLSQKDVILSYLRNDYVSRTGDPQPLTLKKHLINFFVFNVKDKEGTRTVMVSERSLIPSLTQGAPNNAADQSEGNKKKITDQASTRKRKFADLLADVESPRSEPEKKKHHEKQSGGVALQLTTFDGLVELLQCVKLQLHVLSEQAVLVNKVFGYMVQCLQVHCVEEGLSTEAIKKGLTKLHVFKKYWGDRKFEVEAAVVEVFKNESMYDKNLFDIMLNEMFVFTPCNVAQVLYENLVNRAAVTAVSTTE